MHAGLEAAVQVHWTGLQQGCLGRRHEVAPAVHFERAAEGHWAVRLAPSALGSVEAVVQALRRVLPPGSVMHLKSEAGEAAALPLAEGVLGSASVFLAQRLVAIWGESHALALERWCGLSTLVLIDRPSGIWCPTSRGVELRVAAALKTWTVGVEHLAPRADADADIQRALELLTPALPTEDVDLRFTGAWDGAPPTFVRGERHGRACWEDVRLGSGPAPDVAAAPGASLSRLRPAASQTSRASLSASPLPMALP